MHEEHRAGTTKTDTPVGSRYNNLEGYLGSVKLVDCQGSLQVGKGKGEEKERDAHVLSCLLLFCWPVFLWQGVSRSAIPPDILAFPCFT